MRVNVCVGLYVVYLCPTVTSVLFCSLHAAETSDESLQVAYPCSPRCCSSTNTAYCVCVNLLSLLQHSLSTFCNTDLFILTIGVSLR